MKTSNGIMQFFPFIKSAKEYSGKKFKLDILSAMTVAIVALPQSMAYAFIAGVPAQYGLYAAMIPTAIAALFGSSKFLIAGPTNAISMVVASTMGTVVIAGTIARDLPEEQAIALVFLLAFLVGFIQLLMGLLKMGSLINFVSHSVIVGFTAGAGILIAFNQIKNFIGVDIGTHSHFYEKMYHTGLEFGHLNWYSTALGIFTVSFILLAKKFAPKLPGALLAMVLSAMFVAIFSLGDYGVELVAEIPQTLPPLSSFSLDWVSVSAMISPAIAIAILGIVEALAIAKSIASTSGEKIDGNQELIGQGLSNISASFFSSIPGSGSFTRSAVNFKSGALTRFSGVFSAIIIIVVVLVAAPLTRYIPIPSLAGILMVIAYSMIDKKAVALAFKSTSADRIVLVATIASTLILHLEMAIYVGVVLSLILFIRKVAMPEVKMVQPSSPGGKLATIKIGECACEKLAIFQIEGSLFFGAVEKLEEKLQEYKHFEKEVIIIRMKQVNLIDATGIHAFETLLREREEMSGKIILSGVNHEVKEVLVRSGISEKIGIENIVDNTEDAIKLAFDKYIDASECDPKVYLESTK
ncbi:MAG: SulP family inorganic anion transporter [Candidatus Moraniibacteriota bacterium]|jgi:sulfate permease, SulP family